MKDKLQMQLDELVDNPSARLPVCLALDTSGSMAGQPIAELRAAITAFYDAIRRDEMAYITADIAVVKFGGDVQELSDFSGVDSQPPINLVASGNTPMGEAVSRCLTLLDDRKRVLSQMGVDYFQPWLVLMSDGAPTDDISGALMQCGELIRNRKLTVLSIGIGVSADLNTLTMFSSSGTALRIGETDLTKFFQWLSKSVSSVSMSNPGEKKSESLVNESFADLCNKGQSWTDVFGD